MLNSNIKNTTCKILSPKELLSEVKKGNKPEYTHDKKSDKLQNELNALASQYRQSLNINNKVKLLNKEREILFEELKKPELTLARNYDDIKKLLPEDAKGKDVEDILRLFNINGILRSECLCANNDIYKKKDPEKYIDILEEAYLKTDEKTYVGQQAKSTILHIFTWMNYSSDYEYNDKIVKTMKKCYDNTENKDLKNIIVPYISDDKDSGEAAFNKADCLKQLEKQPDEFMLENLINSTNVKDKDVAKYINNVLKSKNTDKGILNTAIWGAGKHRSDENFEIIKKIAIDKKEPDIRKREFAIQSTALYVKDKPEEVKSILESISKEKSVFSPLGKILSEKINGNYYAQPDRALKEAGMTEKEAKKFKRNLKKFFCTGYDIKLNNKKTGHIKIATMPFKKQLGRFVNEGKRYYILKDTCTAITPKEAGLRDFGNGLTNSGFYDDALLGAADVDHCSVSPKELPRDNGYSVITHEMGHMLNFIFDDEDMAKLEKLFKNAVKKDKALDYYAANNSMEYFAQGVEAYNSPYKPHRDLRDDTVNTKYELMVRDPELYKFVEKVLDKY